MKNNLSSIKALIVLATTFANGSICSQIDTYQNTFTADEWEMMTTADSIIAYRLDDMVNRAPLVLPTEIAKNKSFPDSLIDFRDIDRGTEYRTLMQRRLTDSEKKSLRFLFENPDSIYAEYPDQCIYAPGVGIKYFKGKERFYILMCFNCKIWALTRREAMYYFRFDESKREDIVQYAKILFPNDYAIQRLK
jgi:hypothetical protein